MALDRSVNDEGPSSWAGLSPTALVLCGGGSAGAVEVGFYQALTEFGIKTDLVLGSSIGALNGAYIAGGMAPTELARLWREFRLRRALAINWRGLRNWHRYPGLFNLDPLREILLRTLPTTRFEKLAIPLTIVTTDLELGRACYWHGQGDIIEAVAASMSLPGIFPPVEIEGRLHVDGSLASNVPLHKAEELGARSVFMIECACEERCSRPLRGWRDILMRSFAIVLAGKHTAELKYFRSRLELHVVHSQFDREVNLLDFQHSAKLIAAGYSQTQDYLAQALRTQVIRL